MLNNIKTWIMQNKLTTALLVLVAYYFLSPYLFAMRTSQMKVMSSAYMGSESAGRVFENSAPLLGKSAAVQDQYMAQDSATAMPQATGLRMVTRDASLSLVVKKVSTVAAQVEQVTATNGGFVIDSQITNPAENSSATLNVRVPSAKYKAVIAAFRAMAIKVASESEQAADITDSYSDVNERLKPLQTTKAKFEELLKNSREVQDSLTVMRELQNLQYQIDSLVGQQKYLSESAKTSKITLYLSTDEYELPYAPLEPWSFKTVFKNTVRGLVASLRNLAEWAIYIGVNSVIWVPALVIFWVARKKYIGLNKIKN